jgi:hypothetical protein
VARLILVVLTLCAAGEVDGARAKRQPGAEQEPLGAIPVPPIQDPQQVALVKRPFYDEYLSHDNTRICNSRPRHNDNGATALSLSRIRQAIELVMVRSRPPMSLRRILGDPSSSKLTARWR